jgi:trk system potassium uptake protein TrkH
MLEPLPIDSRRAGPRGLPSNPARSIAGLFAAAIAIGTILLLLPASSTADQSVGLMDALFTAASAVCVTGLVVIDTELGWTRFGQTVIMLLIQIGGLGLLTFGSLVAFLLRRRLSFQDRLRLQAEVNAAQVGGVVRLVRGILVFTAGIELSGALIMWPRFAALHGWREGAFQALFHAISAFNNAGFALYSDSLMGFAADPVVLGVTASLLIVGGLGFLVVVHAARHLADRRRPLPLQAKTALITSAVLLLGGAALILMFEWANPGTLGEMSLGGKLLNGFYQSATARTAGFNAVDVGSLRDVSLVLTMILMFIGASPASTGGGIKTVTFFALVKSAVDEVRGHPAVTAFGRTIPLATVVKAGTVAFFSLLLIGVSALLLVMAEPDIAFLPLAFEAFSAFGTVGLSTGVTTDLSTFGRLVIILLMYAGRLGPVTLALALTRRERRLPFDYPEEDLVIG